MARRGGQLRVVAGTAGGRLLRSPPGDTTRPTADRVREAMFNALASLDAVDGSTVIDAFAGSGALGIEALSRGADRAVLVDVDRAVRAVVEDNLAITGLGERAQVVAGDAVAVMRDKGPWDLVLLDPPYAYDAWPELLATAAAALAPDGLVVAESDRDVALPADLELVRSKRYGSTVVAFARRSGATT